MYPTADDTAQTELEEWLSKSLGDRGPTLSVDGVRALAARDLNGVWFDTSLDRPTTFAMMIDGYRPLIELTRIAGWLLRPATDTSDPDRPTPTSRANMLLSLSTVVAHRGYHQLALTYVGWANDIVNASRIDDQQRAAHRFRQGLAHETMSFLLGPDALADTRNWHARLAHDLEQLPKTAGEAQSLAQAIIRTEHCAVNCGLGSARSIGELMAPIQPIVSREIKTAPAENVARLAISLDHLARLIGDHAAANSLARPSVAAITRPRSVPATRHDEWYCAWPAAMARWQLAAPGVDSIDQWRR